MSLFYKDKYNCQAPYTCVFFKTKPRGFLSIFSSSTTFPASRISFCYNAKVITEPDRIGLFFLSPPIKITAEFFTFCILGMPVTKNLFFSEFMPVLPGALIRFSYFPVLQGLVFRVVNALYYINFYRIYQFCLEFSKLTINSMRCPL